METQRTRTPRQSLQRRFFLLLVLAIFSPASLVCAQTTTFTYQGRFTDGGTAANGTYDMQFKSCKLATRAYLTRVRPPLALLRIFRTRRINRPPAISTSAATVPRAAPFRQGW